jgi:hypothetical protein
MITKALIWFFTNSKLYCLSLNNFAIANAVNAFTNSEGCKPNAPKLYQEVAPLTVLPKKNNPKRDTKETM